MSNDIPDFMREFDTDVDYGFTPVSKKPAEETTTNNNVDNLEIAKIKSDVSSIKSSMNEIMQIVAEKDSITKEVENIVGAAPFIKNVEALVAAKGADFDTEMAVPLLPNSKEDTDTCGDNNQKVRDTK